LVTIKGKKPRRDARWKKCGWMTLADMSNADLETWLARESRLEGGKAKRSARSRNAYQTAVVSFCNWCEKSDRAMPENPLDRMDKAKVKTDPRRTRRALTVEEVIRLVEAARAAPARPPSQRKRNPGRSRPGPT
jgi:hypothetical protein